MDLERFGRLLVGLGLLIVLAGAVLVGIAALGIGRLPGDVSPKRGSLRVSVPLMSSIVISIVLTLLLNLFVRR